MTDNPCPVCRVMRLLLLSAVLGAGAGFLVILAGFGQKLSMLATFAGAIIPLMWAARRHHH